MKIASRTERYINEGLGIAGFVLIDYQLAYMIRRDIWPTSLGAGQDWVAADIEQYIRSLPRVKLLEIRFVGSEDAWVLVGTRSDHNLTDRIRWLVGMDVAAVRALSPTRRVATKIFDATQEATNEPPSHQCAARAEHFYKLGIPDPQLAKLQTRKTANPAAGAQK